MLIFIRVDSSKEIGSGHVIRCLTFAECLRELGANVQFITRDHIGNLNSHIKKKGFKLNVLPNNKTSIKKNKYENMLGVSNSVDAKETIEIINNYSAEWMIVDHYALDFIWESEISPFVNKIMVIDDLANRKHNCDVILDQNYTNNKKRYKDLLIVNTIKFIGPKYSILRKDFLENKKNYSKNYLKIKKVFVFFGGTDENNLTLKIIKILNNSRLRHLSADIVIGSANVNSASIKHEIEGRCNVNLHVDVDYISDLMKSADFAIGAGGTTTWERLALGLPSIVITTADNQVALSKDLDKDGYINWLGKFNDVSDKEIYNSIVELSTNIDLVKKMSLKGMQLIRHDGCYTLSKFLIFGPNIDTLIVRQASISDLMFYWSLANDFLTRKNSFNTEKIPLDDHRAWFKNKLNSKNSILLIAESKFGKVGQVRFDYVDSQYIIDFSIAKNFRGFGFGKIIIRDAIKHIRAEHATTIIAKVKSSNIASIKVFESLKFKRSSYIMRENIYIFKKEIYAP